MMYQTNATESGRSRPGRLAGIFTVALLSLALPASAAAQTYSEVLIFGDSLSDTGNILARTFGLFPPDPPYFAGRFSDGAVWVEYLAEDLNLTVTPNGSNPDVINGNNFAFGGAEAANDVPIFPLGFIPSVQSQVQSFVIAAGTVPSDALAIVLGGGNDLRYAADPGSGLTPQEQEQVIQDAVDAIVLAVSILATAGAEQVLVPNAPNLGATPEAGVIGNEAEATLVTMQFNDSLSSALDAAADDLDVDIIQFDTFAFLETIVDDALNNGGALYGITNIDTPIAPGLPGEPRDAPAAEDPAAALWADDIHPSTVAHAVFAESVFEVLAANPADLDGDGVVGATDLAILLASWGPCDGCPADLDGDGLVGSTDLAALLGSWG